LLGISKPFPSGSPRLALCYIRQSYGRDETLLNSIDRQTSNVLSLCQQQAWEPLVFVEPEGHRSAYGEDNRPEWQRLKEWLDNPQVVAVVANDPSRLYRKMWCMGSFIETLDHWQVQLRFASPGSPVKDISHPADRFILQMYALMDESYVHDMARRQKDNVAYRKARGITTGMTPFGLVRNAQGYLIPSALGAWMMANGRAVPGHRQGDRPTEGGEWRRYYHCAYRILTLYAGGDLGRDTIARRLDEEGWRFKDRWGQPRPLVADDIRRVTGNWAEYGGMVGLNRAKDRAVDGLDVATLAFVPERAVFPLELLGAVVEVMQARCHRRGRDRTPRREPLPLANLCVCAHCDMEATPDQGRPQRTP